MKILQDIVKFVTGSYTPSKQKRIKDFLETVREDASKEGWAECWLCTTFGAQMLREVEDVNLRELNIQFLAKYGIADIEKAAFPVHNIVEHVYGVRIRHGERRLDYDNLMVMVRKELFCFWYKEITGEKYMTPKGFM